VGEAAKRKTAEQKWLATLSESEREVVHVAKAVNSVFGPLDGACYRMSFFLKFYLAQEHGVSGKAVVGFVNDGTDVIYSSHAWYVYQGLMTDLALCRPLEPEVQKAGPQIIHGRTYANGWGRYTYHLKRPPEGQAFIERLLADTEASEQVEAQEKLHLQMLATADDDSLIRTYLDLAPDGADYSKLVQAVKAAKQTLR
jgi:hypothetical protein